MTEKDTYLQADNPTIDDWIECNSEVFESLKNEDKRRYAGFAPLVDLQFHAQEAGVSTTELFSEIKSRVGSLGVAALQLVHSEMDDAWHITLAHKEEL